MDVTVELKRRRGEILDRLVEIREAQANLEAQMGALDQVIAIYEPGYVPAGSMTGSKIRKKHQKSPDISKSTRCCAASSQPMQSLRSCGKPQHR